MSLRALLLAPAHRRVRDVMVPDVTSSDGFQVDDLLIDAFGVDIDGVGGTLGVQARAT